MSQEIAQYIVFGNGQPDIVFGSPNNAKPGEVWLPFVPVNGDTRAQYYNHDGSGNLTYSAPAVSRIAIPLTIQFLQNVAANTSNTGALIIAQRMAFIAQKDLSALKQKWAEHASFKSASPAIAAMFETEAAAANMPLV